jgi:hypothetical protein
MAAIRRFESNGAISVTRLSEMLTVTMVANSTKDRMPRFPIMAASHSPMADRIINDLGGKA